MNFKERLKGLLVFRNMNMRKLAALSGVSQRTLENYLHRDDAMPRADVALSIANALGVTLEYLVTDKTPLTATTLATKLREYDKLHAPGAVLYTPPPLSERAQELLPYLEKLSLSDCRVLTQLARSLRTERERKDRTRKKAAPKA
jgi:transcriptional regulator with XRE-family HTH domain